MDAAVPVYSNVGSAIQIDKAGDEQGEFLQKLREWAARDFEGALAGAMKLPEGDERNQALAAVCYGIGQTHPADALALAQTLNLDKQSGGIMQGLVQQWATSDFSAALDWVNNQPAGDQRDGLTQRMAFVLSQTQPADAAALVLNQIPSGKAQNKAILTVLDLWADQDVTAAMAWASSFPDGPLREEALGKLRHQQLAAQ